MRPAGPSPCITSPCITMLGGQGHFASTAGWVGGGALQKSVQLAGNGALKAAADLALALALGDAAAGVGPGWPVMDLAEHHDVVQGPVQLPVSAPVEAMADDLARGRRDRGRPASMAKAASERSRPGWDQLISSWAAVMGPMPDWVSRAGATAMMSWRSSASSWWASCRAARAR